MNSKAEKRTVVFEGNEQTVFLEKNPDGSTALGISAGGFTCVLPVRAWIAPYLGEINVVTVRADQEETQR